jgi:hypothetical protein
MWSFDSKRPKRLAGTWRTKESYLVWKKKGKKTAKSKMMTFACCSTCFYWCLDAPFDLLRALTVEPCFLRLIRKFLFLFSKTSKISRKVVDYISFFESFRDNRPNILIFAKVAYYFLLREIIQLFLKHSTIFALKCASVSVFHFVEAFKKTKYFRAKFREN